MLRTHIRYTTQPHIRYTCTDVHIPAHVIQHPMYMYQRTSHTYIHVYQRTHTYILHTRTCIECRVPTHTHIHIYILHILDTQNNPSTALSTYRIRHQRCRTVCGGINQGSLAAWHSPRPNAQFAVHVCTEDILGQLTARVSLSPCATRPHVLPCHLASISDFAVVVDRTPGGTPARAPLSAATRPHVLPCHLASISDFAVVVDETRQAAPTSCM